MLSDSSFNDKRLCLQSQLNNSFYPTQSHSLSSSKQMSFHRASVSENALSAGCSLLLDEVFVLIPWHRIHIISTTLSPPSSLEQRFNSLITAFLSVVHKLNILVVPETPTASARCRLPSLHPYVSLFCVCVCVFLPTGKTHSFLLYPFFYVGFFSSSLCASPVAFIFIVFLSYWPPEMSSFFFFLLIH